MRGRRAIRIVEPTAAQIAYKAWQQTQPCKDQQRLVRADGGCLRCEADAGEAGRHCPPRAPRKYDDMNRTIRLSAAR